MTFLVVFLVMVLVVGMMAVGVMMGRKPIAGSCGGIANLGIEKECSIFGCRPIITPTAIMPTTSTMTRNTTKNVIARLLQRIAARKPELSV